MNPKMHLHISEDRVSDELRKYWEARLDELADHVAVCSALDPGGRICPAVVVDSQGRHLTVREVIA